MTEMISTYKLSKQYDGVYRVKDLNLKVYEGDIYGFLGPNGAGKSTALKMLLGLVKPTDGGVNMFGKEFGANRLFILKNTGSLIESPSYYGHLSGLENMRVMQRLLNVPNRNVDEALRIVRLESHKGKKVSQYSLGMKQRLGIAMALMGFPKLLILDEPTNGLDPAGIQEIRELIQSLPQRFGMTVLISSHLLSEIDQIATKVGIINNGELIFQNSMDALRAQSKRTVALRTQNISEAKSILQKYRFTPVHQDDYLIFEDMPDEQIATINQLLVTSGIGVTRIEERRKKLEDIFLELTGKVSSL
ncbi:ATP-binding cassette domain-containing protein [Aneurinibacillus aneurinilyticus]|uniref:ATP-binding cassette domain-containing protein n=2 Tax=Aneurinibacillus aneurinilyticus TaxID=1391 RepID=A0A848CWQ4_ANEAE|nr:ATP-binding cassette domain-containing protein [Aneurinibacillus aneurinilyticus]MCI1696160.1 ATP-binding cassette domain-containing protein [Aneurinibacillus aneurinilyticus]MED0671689.1 ATP-binding cassette domain-containing protein [Aneurinibacillus aneurinilyticus]MED0705082.1 ATP-binding cassette domain-containing protein [Aneurinibacillus aneurinilyticus]MED0724275.1 ATP-binding cassette domain-containing protein [Aneurinibacillus aneurinilyticus]MED0733083.1 ATP-binding cassette doma